jgi:hypothetical protein
MVRLKQSSLSLSSIYFSLVKAELVIRARFSIHDVIFVAMTKIWGPMKANIDELPNFDSPDEERISNDEKYVIWAS